MPTAAAVVPATAALPAAAVAPAAVAVPIIWSCRSLCEHMIRIFKFSLGCCMLPAAVVVDYICDAAICLLSPRTAAHINRRRCGIAVALATMIWGAIFVSAFSLNGPHIAGVCVCRHSMWKGELATIITTPMEDLSPYELCCAFISCVSKSLRLGAELAARFSRVLGRNGISILFMALCARVLR